MSGSGPVLRCLVVALVLTVQIAAGAQAPDAPALAWTPVVDLYLEGRASDAAAAVLARRPDEVTAAARAAFATWRREAGATPSNDATRVRRRRLQASAMLPLEILLAIRMPAAPSPRLTALERVSRDACEELDAQQRSAGRSAASAPPASTAALRNWWRIGLLQFLVATGRYGDFRQQADVFGTPSDDDEAAAEYHFLRGLSAETQARLPEETSIGAGSRAEAPRPRAPFIVDALGEARRQYTRALAFRSITPSRRFAWRASISKPIVAVQRERRSPVSPPSRARTSPAVSPGCSWARPTTGTVLAQLRRRPSVSPRRSLRWRAPRISE